MAPLNPLPLDFDFYVVFCASMVMAAITEFAVIEWDCRKCGAHFSGGWLEHLYDVFHGCPGCREKEKRER